MRCSAVSAGIVLSLLAGCGGSDQGRRADLPHGIDSAITAYNDSVDRAVASDSTNARAPRVLGLDTLYTRVEYRCTPSLIASVAYWNGPNARVVVALLDTVMSLPQVIAASGARYALDRPAAEWWNKGDSARFTWRGKVHQCGPDPTIEF